MRLRGRNAAIAVIGLMLAAGLFVYFAPSFYEVVDKGPYVRPYAPDPESVYELRLFGAITVYGDSESQPRTDVISGAILVALSTAALMAFLLLRAALAPQRIRRFYGIATLGLAYLAVDELMAIHETVGHNLLFLTDLPGVERPDDFVIALYVVPAVVYIYVFRDVLLDEVRSRLLFGAAIALFACAGIADVSGLAVDELFEVLSGVCIGAGFFLLLATHLTTYLGLSERSQVGSTSPSTVSKHDDR